MNARSVAKQNPRPTSLPRRTLLRGALGGGVAVSIGLPLFDAMLNEHGDALAQGGALPSRFGVFHWGCGINHSAWVPDQTGTDWALPYSLQPLSTLKPYVTLVTGYNHADSSPGHIPARGIALSSSHDMAICQGECVGVYRGQSHPEPTLDVIVAEAFSGKAKFDSLEVGICRSGPYAANSSWRRGGNSYNRHEYSPVSFWERLFSDGAPTAEPPTVDPGEARLTAATAELKKSMLDAAAADIADLQIKLGTSDRRRLDQHLEGLRALEQRIQLGSGLGLGLGAGCVTPSRPTNDSQDEDQKGPRSMVMSGLLATAIACDQTRVFSYEWSANQSNVTYPEVGVNAEHHEFSHTDVYTQGFKDITRFIMQHFAALGEMLAAQPEGAGNVLDNTLIFATSEHANPSNHDYFDHPLLLVGKAGGRIRAGQHHRHSTPGDNIDAPRVMLTAVRAAGVNVTSLGQPDSDAPRVATTSISGLEA